MMKIESFIFFLILLTSSVESSAQEFLDRNKLIQQLSIAPQDTNRVLLYISIGQQYENNQPDSAIYYYLKAKELSETLGYTTGTMKYLSNITYVLNTQGKYDSALQLNLMSVDLARTHGKPRQLAACLGNVANSYLYLERYEDAIDYFLQASDLIGKVGNKQYQCILFNNLAIIYNKLKQPEKGREYAEKAVALARETNDLYNLGISLDNLALTVITSGIPEKALPYLKEGLDITEKTENIYTKESILINYADVYRQMGEFDKIKSYAQEGLQLAKELEDVSGEATAYLGLGYYALYRNELDEALEFARQSEKEAASANLSEQLANAYALLGHISLGRKNYLEFQKFQFKHDSMETHAVNERILNNIQDLETKYETEKKVQQINKLEQDKAIQALRLRQGKFILIALTGVVVAIVVVSLLFVRSNRQKQLILKQEKELQERRIGELETEKQLTVTEAVLKGQDAERTRLARDLHDGLGGMLSGIKLSFMNLKDTLAKRLDDKQQFDRSLDMLDGSIIELRRVAHNLMPETLLKFGLDKALSDYCDKITESGAILVSYQSINLEKLQTDQTVLITIYRIVQELVNNIVRHASASNCYVQLACNANHLTISVEDDGKGFDVEMIHNSPGMGWSNIQDRIQYLKGTIDVQSESKGGTTINIDLNI
jgi:two-component system, NarL family, sensor kinase